MKFGKRLRALVQESDEEWRPNFMDYKILKKSIITRDMNPGNIHQTHSNTNSDESNSENNGSNTVNTINSVIVNNTSATPMAIDHDMGIMQTPTNANVTSNHITQNAISLGHDQLNSNNHHPRQLNVTHDSTPVNDSDDDDDDEIAIVQHVENVHANKQAVLQAERLHAEFFRLFRNEVCKVNEFFLEKQEDFIIEHRRLAMRVLQLQGLSSLSRRDINVLRSRLTNFHGELVVLEKFSMVNYTGFRKILKKHDKKTGLNIQHTYLNTVLITPFFLCDTVRRLILSTEAQLAQLDNLVKYKNLDYPSLATYQQLQQLQQQHDALMQTQTQ